MSFCLFPLVFSQSIASYTKSDRVIAKDVICASLGSRPDPPISAYRQLSGHKELALTLEFNRKMTQNNGDQNQCKTKYGLKNKHQFPQQQREKKLEKWSQQMVLVILSKTFSRLLQALQEAPQSGLWLCVCNFMVCFGWVMHTDQSYLVTNSEHSVLTGEMLSLPSSTLLFNWGQDWLTLRLVLPERIPLPCLSTDSGSNCSAEG